MRWSIEWAKHKWRILIKWAPTNTDLDAEVLCLLQKLLQLSFRFRKRHRSVAEEVQNGAEVFSAPVCQKVDQLVLCGSGCSTAAHQMPHDQKVMGSDLARWWAFKYLSIFFKEGQTRDMFPFIFSNKQCLKPHGYCIPSSYSSLLIFLKKAPFDYSIN